MKTLIDLTGKKFEKWTVIEKGTFTNGKSYWLCQCECGTVKLVDGDTLRRGTSTGCLKCRTHFVKHGKSNEKIYWVWHGMIQRCEYPNSKFYKNYGGRGVKVCEEWHEFKPFYDWAMANGYQQGVEIDRMNVDGNYEPSNCQWITHKAQQSNKTCNRIIEFNGILQTLQQWADSLGIKSNTLHGRINHHGIEKSLSVGLVGRGAKIS